MIKLKEKDKEFIKEYLTINMPYYKMIVDDDHPDNIQICFKSIKKDFETIFKGKELDLVIGLTKDSLYHKLLGL